MAEKSYTADIHPQPRENDDLRAVLFTRKHSQLVVVSVPAGKDIGKETHEGIDRILTIVEGEGVTNGAVSHKTPNFSGMNKHNGCGNASASAKPGAPG